jgi:Domain of unknown function (DUF5666)
MFDTLDAPAWRRAAAGLLALSAAVITACGGGGDATGSTAVTTEQATAYAAGPISGFGSVIVNGRRFDDSKAVVTDDDDRARSKDLLRLGMMTEIDARAMNAAAGTGEALRIRYGSSIVGPVDAAPAESSLQVLGQKVNVTATTVFDSTLAGGLSTIKAGDVLEVHAQYDAATNTYTATRIESAAGATTYKLRGLVSALNKTNKTFTLGGQPISYGNVAEADLPQALADGQLVRVRLQPSPKTATGQWIATSVRTGVRKVEDRAEGHVRGAITVFATTASFEIDGLKVNAANANFPDGSAGVKLGAVVEVEGAIVDGVLVATKVELDERHAMERHAFELHGAISGLDKTAKTFMLRGVKVSYGAPGVNWKKGSESDLADGKKIEVKGRPSNDRAQLVAISIKFED